MNKAELVGEVANQTGLTKKASREAVDAVISAITDSLVRGERVTLVGFGTFQVMERKARQGKARQGKARQGKESTPKPEELSKSQLKKSPNLGQARV